MAACTQLPRQVELSPNVTDDATKPNELPLGAAVSDALSTAAREAAPRGSSVGAQRDWELIQPNAGNTEQVTEYEAAAADLDAALALIESDLDAAIENPNAMSQTAPELLPLTMEARPPPAHALGSLVAPPAVPPLQAAPPARTHQQKAAENGSEDTTHRCGMGGCIRESRHSGLCNVVLPSSSRRCAGRGLAATDKQPVDRNTRPATSKPISKQYRLNNTQTGVNGSSGRSCLKGPPDAADAVRRQKTLRDCIVRASSQVSQDQQADTVAVRASSQVSRDQQAEEQIHQVVYECENCCGFESTCVAFVEDHETRCTFGRDGGKRQQIEHSEAEQQVHRLRKRFKINQSAAMACFEAGAASALPSAGALTTARPRQMQKLREAAIQEAAIKVFKRNARAFCCDQVHMRTAAVLLLSIFWLADRD